MNISLVKNQEAWDAFIKNSDEAGPYHLYGWGKAIKESYGHEPYYLQAIDDHTGKIIGVLPLIHFKVPLISNALIALPYCDYANILGSDDTKIGLINQALQLGKRLNISQIELRSTTNLNPCLQSLEVKTLSHKVRMLLSLPDSPEVLWKGFKSKLRSQIRKPTKEGLTGKIGGAELLNDFYKVFSLNMHSLGSPVHSIEWFYKLLDGFKDQAKVGIIYLPNRVPAAAGIILTCGAKISIPWASSLREYNRLAPNMLLYWNFLKWGCESGFTEFDFGRSTPGEGTYRFKKQWGARPVELFWHFISTKKQTRKKNKSASPQLMTRLRPFVERSWKKLPLSLSLSIGPKLRKYISL